MRRIIIDRPGGYERLRLVEEPDPVAGAGESLVEVEAAGVNYADCCVRMGVYSSAKEYAGWPITPGFEVAGRVGDRRVVALTRFGGYASHVVVPDHQVFEIPDGVETTAAAGFPTVFLTAYYALFELAQVKAGATVLIHSAAGGVGSAAVQLAALAGARAVGVVGAPHKVGKVDADASVIDKSRDNLWEEARRHAPEGYDVILDANGVSTLRQSYEHLRPTGRLITYGFASMLPRGGGRLNRIKLAWAYLRTPRFNPIDMTTRNRSVLAFNLSYLFDRRDLLEPAMDRLMGWWREDRIRTPEVTTFPLERAADAHRALESGTTTGKLVLTV